MILGIDPGQTGAIAFLEDNGQIGVIDLPTMERDAKGRLEIDPWRLDKILKALTPAQLVVMEEVGANGLFGASRAFAFGGDTRCVLTILRLILGEDPRLIPPKTWQTALFGKQPAGDTKKNSLAFVAKMYPTLKIERHDESDAVCLAVYGERFLVNVGKSKSK